jgi:hypothetical protein
MLRITGSLNLCRLQTLPMNLAASFLNLFSNKGIDAFNFSNILHHKKVQSRIPEYFKSKSTPRISYTCTPNIASKLFNYNQTLQSLYIKRSSSNILRHQMVHILYSRILQVQVYTPYLVDIGPVVLKNKSEMSKRQGTGELIKKITPEFYFTLFHKQTHRAKSYNLCQDLIVAFTMLISACLASVCGNTSKDFLALSPNS